MGATFDSRNYKGKYTKDKILELFKTDVEQALYDYGHHGYSGTIAEKGHESVKIDWQSKMFPTLERAETYIQEHSEKWENAIGVFYKNDDEEGCIVGGWCSA
jgi:hypothetical protein